MVRQDHGATLTRVIQNATKKQAEPVATQKRHMPHLLVLFEREVVDVPVGPSL
jgi:hypothetical protein